MCSTLRLNSRPDTAGLVRAVLGGIAPPFALRPELLNDLKTVVSEACNNAVDHAYRSETGAIAVRVDIQLEIATISTPSTRLASAWKIIPAITSPNASSTAL